MPLPTAPICKMPTPKPFPPNPTSQNPRPRSHEKRVTQPGKTRDPGLTASQPSCSLKSHRQRDTPTLIPLFQLTHLPECQPTQPIGIPPARNADARAPLRRANAEIACKPCRCFVAPNVCIALPRPQARTRRILFTSFSKPSPHSISATPLPKRNESCAGDTTARSQSAQSAPGLKNTAHSPTTPVSDLHAENSSGLKLSYALTSSIINRSTVSCFH